MDYDEIADELYGLDPADFVPARDGYVREARQAGDRALAERIRRLRRPTRGAWLANLLVHTQPEQTQRFLELGRALRRAQQELAGSQLRELTSQRQQLLTVMADQACQAATRLGSRPSQTQVEELDQTLRAALADDQAAGAFAAGRLTGALQPGLVLPDTLPAVPPPAPLAPTGPRAADAGQVRPVERPSAVTRQAEHGAAARRRREESERRRAVKAAEQALRSAQAAAERARARMEATGGEVEHAQARLRQAEQTLHSAQEQLELAEHDRRERAMAASAARERVDSARRNLEEAWRRLRAVTGEKAG